MVNAVVRRGERTPVFVVSDAPERATAWRIARGALVATGFGAVFLLVVLVFAVGML